MSAQEFEHTGVIVPRFWDAFRGKSAEVKVLGVFLVTGRHNAGLPGCCVIGWAAIAEEIEVTPERLAELWAQLPAGFAQYDKAHRVLRVQNAPRYCHRPNHQVLRVWWRRWRSMPDSALKFEHIESLRCSLPNEPSDLVQRAWDETFGSVEILKSSTDGAMGGGIHAATGNAMGGLTHPLSQSQSLSLSLGPDPEKISETVGKSTPRVRAPKQDDAVTAARRRTTDHWNSRYAERTGSNPFWDGKAFGLLYPLIGAVGADEVCRRIDVLFDAPPRFLAGATPDIGTLRQHFDKLAAPARIGLGTGSAAPTGDDLRALAAEMERRGVGQ
jgi:hypothetical protein